MEEDEKVRRRKNPVNKGFYIKFSERDPRDMALWEMLLVDLEDPEVNVSAAMKGMLYDWCIARRATGSIIPGILGLRAPGGSPSQHVLALAASHTSEITTDDDLARNMLTLNFDEM